MGHGLIGLLSHELRSQRYGTLRRILDLHSCVQWRVGFEGVFSYLPGFWQFHKPPSLTQNQEDGARHLHWNNLRVVGMWNCQNVVVTDCHTISVVSPARKWRTVATSNLSYNGFIIRLRFLKDGNDPSHSNDTEEHTYSSMVTLRKWDGRCSHTPSYEVLRPFRDV